MIHILSVLWSNLKKEPFITFLFILQIAITAFVLFSSGFEVKSESDQLNSVNLAYSNYYFYRFGYNFAAFFHVAESISGSNKNGFVEQMDSTIEDLKKIDGLHPAVNICDGVDLYVYDTLDAWDEEGCSESEFSLVYRSPDGKRTFWHQVFADKAYFDVFGKPRLDSGRFFTDDEFKLTYEEGSVVPVVLGYDFKKYCKIGDTFDAKVISEVEDLVKIEVVGFVDDGEVYVEINGNTLYSYNRVVIVPFNDRHYYEYNPRHMTVVGDGLDLGDCYQTFALSYKKRLLLVEKERKDEVLEQMNEVLKKHGLEEKLYFIKPKTDTVSIANNYRENMNIRLWLTYITVLFAFVSVVLMTVNRISSNIRNYAVHLISGGTFGNIYSYVVGEICIYTLLGFILGSNAYGIRNIITNYVNTMPAESEYGFYVGWGICLSMLVLFAIISLIIVVIRLKHTDLSSVIRDKTQTGSSRGRIYKIITVTSFSVISFCIIFAVSYYVHINSVDMYYRHFYTEHTKKVDVFNDPSLGADVDVKPRYKGLAEDYVIDKFVTIMYSDEAPYIRGTYYEGNVALPDILEGRYFSEEELSGGRRKKVVVMGRKAYEDFATVREDGTAYFTYVGTDYEVIGIMGKADGTVTRLDEWVFMPLDTVLGTYGKMGTYFIDGKTKKNVKDANEAFLAALEGNAQAESHDQKLTEVIIGPTDALASLALMIILNIIIVCIYYTDRRQYVTAVKKFIGYSKSMIFGGIFAGFLKLAAIGFAIGALITLIITVTPAKEIQMFGALSLNLPTVLLSVAATACLAFIFAVIAVNRTYSRDTSDVIRE